MAIQLGALVKDEITGFTGVVLARMESLYEATMCQVHPRAMKDEGPPKERFWFEEDRLVLLEDHAVVGFKTIAGVTEAKLG